MSKPILDNPKVGVSGIPELDSMAEAQRSNMAFYFLPLNLKVALTCPQWGVQRTVSRKHRRWAAWWVHGLQEVPAETVHQAAGSTYLLMFPQESRC